MSFSSDTAVTRRGDVFDAAFQGVGVNQRVLELDAYQPEPDLYDRPLGPWPEPAAVDDSMPF